MKPAQPRYTFTWDVSIVLQYLQTLYPLEDLSFQQLTEKTVTLLTLRTAHRVQTLASIKLSNIQIKTDSIEIKIMDKIKTSGPGRLQPLLVLPQYREKPSLYVKLTLSTYLSRTENLRGSSQSLFIAIKKPFIPVGAQTLSRWIKKTIQSSDIDVTIFKAHSVRHAATSKAYMKGVDINTIRETAGWTQGSQTFAQFKIGP